MTNFIISTFELSILSKHHELQMRDIWTILKYLLPVKTPVYDVADISVTPSIYFVMCKPLVFPFYLLISPTHHLLCSKPILRTFAVLWFSLESNPGNLSAILGQVPRRPEADFRVGKLTYERAWYALRATKLECLNLYLTNKGSVPTQTDQ